MTDIDEFTDRVRQEVKQLPELMLDALEKRAHDMTGNIQERIQEEGVNDEGMPFIEYTEEYQAKKEAKGRYRGFVDLTLDDRMLNSIDIVESSFDDGKATVTLRSKNEEDQIKIDENSIKRPFLKPSKDEIKRAEDNLLKDAERIVQNFFR